MLSDAGFKYLQSLLQDPENDDRTVKELFYEMREYEQERNKDLLTPVGLEKQAAIQTRHRAPRWIAPRKATACATRSRRPCPWR